MSQGERSWRGLGVEPQEHECLSCQRRRGVRPLDQVDQRSQPLPLLLAGFGSDTVQPAVIRGGERGPIPAVLIGLAPLGRDAVAVVVARAEQFQQVLRGEDEPGPWWWCGHVSPPPDRAGCPRPSDATRAAWWRGSRRR